MTRDRFWFFSAWHISFLLAVKVVLSLNLVDTRTAGAVQLHVALLVNLLAFLWSYSSVVQTNLLRRQAAAWVLIFVNILYSVEITGRLIPYVDTSDSNPGFAHFNPDSFNRVQNSFRYFDREFSIKKPEKTFRILAIGNSYTQGVGLKRQETFPHVTEEFLNRTLREAGTEYAAEVYNMGVAGYYGAEQLETALKEAKRFRPDAIVIHFLYTDLINPAVETSRPQIVRSSLEKRMQRTAKTFLEKTGSYAFYRLYQQINIFTHAGSDFWKDMEDRYTSTSKNWLTIRDGYEQLAAYAKKNSIQLHFVVFPTLADAASDEKTRPFFEKAIQLTRDLNYQIIDLRPVFAKHSSNLGKLSFSPQDLHPSPHGAKVAAEAIAQELSKSIGIRRITSSDSP